MFFINCHLVQKLCKVYVSEPFFVGPLLSLQTAVVAPWSMCTYWHTGQSLVWWSARADENVVRVGSVAWRAEETAEWPVATSPGSLPTHRTWDSPEQSRAATLLLISLPRITWLYDPWSRNMEYWNTQSWEKIQLWAVRSLFHSFHGPCLISRCVS